MSPEQRKAYHEEEARKIEAMKELCSKEHRLERGPKFDKVWRLAWDYGHASGFDEVKNYFDELAELAKP